MFHLVVILIGLVVLSCGQNEQVIAPKNIRESFRVTGDGNKEPVRISILKTSLEKEFLLQGNVIDQTVTATGNAIRSRIVAFRYKNGKLYLLEASQGHVVTSELPSQLLLAEFPVLAEDESAVTFDFNAGMASIFTSRDYWGEDFDGKDYEPAFSSAKVRVSYLESAKTDETDRLLIKQVAQAELPGFFGSIRIIPVEVRYYLEPYRPTPNFVPSKSGDFKLAGFFQVSPKWTAQGRTQIYSTKQDVQKPIVFAISSNTPHEYRESVRDGILYWNKAHGSDLIRVVDAPQGLTAPDINYNIIQWVSHDSASGAYADFQMDPRTGQILHAQAYVASVFAFKGIQRARAMLRKLKAHSKKAARGLALKGFEQDSLCDYGINESLASSLTDLLASRPNSDQLLRLSQDYVAAVVAHEVGHLMGLRHNFAGSLHTHQYSYLEKDAVFSKYLEQGEVDSRVVVSSTIMDYPRLEEDVLIGHAIRQGHAVLEYDQKAIEMLYRGKSYNVNEIPPFCTDSQVGEYVDCERGDVGSSVVESSLLATEGNLKKLPNVLMERFIAARAPELGVEPQDLESIPFSPDQIASDSFSLRNKLVSTFTGNNHLLAIFRLFKDTGPLGTESIRKAEMEYFLEQIEKLGGMARFFAVVKPDYYSGATAEFSQLAQSPSYQSGEGLAGQAYSFSDSDIALMVKRVELLMKHLPKSVAKSDLAMLKSIPADWKTNDSRLGEAIGQVLEDRMATYVLSAGNETIDLEIEYPEVVKVNGKDEVKMENGTPVMQKKSVKLPKYFYGIEERKSAATLLNAPDEPESVGWAFDQRNKLKARLVVQLNTACGCNIELIKTDQIKTSDTSKRNAMARWFIENKEVLEKVK